MTKVAPSSKMNSKTIFYYTERITKFPTKQLFHVVNSTDYILIS